MAIAGSSFHHYLTLHTAAGDRVLSERGWGCDVRYEQQLTSSSPTEQVEAGEHPQDCWLVRQKDNLAQDRSIDETGPSFYKPLQTLQRSTSPGCHKVQSLTRTGLLQKHWTMGSCGLAIIPRGRVLQRGIDSRLTRSKYGHQVSGIRHQASGIRGLDRKDRKKERKNTIMYKHRCACSWAR